ncbi:MAG: siderophore-interacting protein [Pseudomonadota bacterium]
MSKKPQPRTLAVLAKRQISPHMRRITLGGPELQGFPSDQDSAYVKLRFADKDNSSVTVMRTYTVRYFREEARELDVDFVLHDVSGPAADWARACQVGDSITIAGPGPKKLVDFSADWFLLVGDMSALPAISANLEAMPSTAKGFALLEVIDQSDQQDLVKPDDIDIKWIVNPHPDEKNSFLLDTVKSLEWPEGKPSVWVAGEFSQSLSIRSYLKSERGVTRTEMYCSSYWQIGKSEDGHRVSKQGVSEKLG